jgi:hypothetical protein
MNRRATTSVVALGVGATALFTGLGGAQPPPQTDAKAPGARQAQQPVPPSSAITNAKLKTALPCYLRNQTVRIGGSGFSPGASYSVILDRMTIGTSTVAADGSVAGSLSSGNLAHGVHELRHRLQVTDGTNVGRVGFSTTAFDAAFTPPTGDPRTLRVNFAVYGIGLGHSGPVDVFLHYLDPRGHLLATIDLGRTLGACGNLARSPTRPLFPFQHVVAGKWMLQFDTNGSYSANNQPRITRSVAVG